MPNQTECDATMRSADPLRRWHFRCSRPAGHSGLHSGRQAVGRPPAGASAYRPGSDLLWGDPDRVVHEITMNVAAHRVSA